MVRAGMAAASTLWVPHLGVAEDTVRMLIRWDWGIKSHKKEKL